MAEFTVAKFKDVSEGLQEGQFAIGDRTKASGLADLDPIYRDLLDKPITVTLGLIGPDGRVNMTPMWFDYEGDTILVNTASHRPKCGWIRNNPQLTIPAREPRESLPLDEHQVHGGERDTRGRAGRRAGDRTARPHLDEIHGRGPALRAKGPRDRREARALRVPCGPGGHVRKAGVRTWVCRVGHLCPPHIRGCQKSPCAPPPRIEAVGAGPT